jgi:hypothetical protein
MNVIDVPLQIGAIPDLMFPIPSLPNPFLATSGLAGAAPRIGYKLPREPALDDAPTQSEIRFALR